MLIIMLTRSSLETRVKPGCVFTAYLKMEPQRFFEATVPSISGISRLSPSDFTLGVSLKPFNWGSVTVSLNLGELDSAGRRGVLFVNVIMRPDEFICLGSIL